VVVCDHAPLSHFSVCVRVFAVLIESGGGVGAGVKPGQPPYLPC